MKVAIYVRVSTNDQSTEMQLRDLQEYVKARGLEVYKMYEDHGVSGSKTKRPALDALMDDAKKHKFQTVVVWRFDRFARSVEHLVVALRELSERGIDFVSYKENLDTTTSTGKAMFQMIAVMAELERNIIRERVLAGINNAKLKGKRLGRKPTINQLIINTIFTMASNGKSIREIASHLGIGKSSVQRSLKYGQQKSII